MERACASSGTLSRARRYAYAQHACAHHGAQDARPPRRQDARSSRRLPSLTSPQVLTKALKQLEQHMRDLSYSPSDHISVSSALIGEADSQGVLTMWDLSGGKDYGSVLQPYLCDGSVYLLVVPALDVSILKTMYELYVGR